MDDRTYLAAHAPKVPDWFQHDEVPGEPKRPAVPRCPEDVSGGDWNSIRQGQGNDVLKYAFDSAPIQVAIKLWNAYLVEKAEFEDACADWMHQNSAARFYSWRWAYADAMLRARDESAKANGGTIPEEAELHR